MRCAGCNTENRAEARFCRACGTALPRTCPACGAGISSDCLFCDLCGARVEAGAAPADARSAPSSPPSGPSASPAPASYTPRHLADRILTTRAAIEGERKHVTVLFADCAGFTAIAERIDPEEVHGIMERCFKVILGEVHRYEGTVNQFTGDGVMALFGAPVALEDAPLRAVRAALGIQRALESLRAELRASRGIEFRMRIGIHTGLVVVGKIGDDLRMDYTALGDTTNLASRLQGLARPGSILISGATRRLVHAHFDLEDLGDLKVKGKTKPTRAFEVIGERAARSGHDLLSGSGLTPLVGRERELALLRDAFDSARDGHGQVVFLVGEAGLGKSRLLLEFRRRLKGDALFWIEGHCTSYGRNTAFLPIADGLRRYFEIEDRDDDAAAIAKVEKGIALFGEDLAWMLPFLRQMLSLPSGDPAVDALDAITRRAETFRALKTLALRAAERRPLVLLVEDLHWIDPASEEYLAFLSDAVAPTRALLILSHRPGYQHPFGDRSYHTRIAIRPLSDAEMATMTHALLGTLEVPPELRRLIAGKAEGNPFFVEEVTKSLIEEGALLLEGGRVRLARKLADIVVPDRIQDVIMARIDRLSDDRKRAIQVASVIGREFALRLLERITEMGERVQGLVDELRGLELIYEKAAHPELAYMFKHALTHDVAYESILIQRRKALHGAIGTTIEELYAERLAEHYETLAHHFTLAEDWKRALTYHRIAGRKALDAYANHAAITHCRRALEIADRLDGEVPGAERAELEEMLGTACWFVSEFRPSGEAYLRAAEATEDPEARGMRFGDAAQSFYWGHDYESGDRVVEQGLALGRSHGLGAPVGYALGMKAFRAAIHGRLDEADALLAESQQLAALNGDEGLIAMTRFPEAELADWRSDFPRAVAICEEVLPVARRRGITHLIVWPQWFLGKSTCGLGQYGRAIASLRDSLDLCERIGDRAWRTRILNTLGWVYAEFGSDRIARDFNERAARLAHEVGDHEIIANAEINLARNSLALGDPDRAESYLEPIREGLEKRDPFMRWRYTLHLLDALGCLALARGQSERALGLADEELAGARGHRVRKLEARALELRARALLALDRRDDSAAACTQAIAVAETIGYPPTRWRSLGLLAEIHRREGNVRESETQAARMRGVIDLLVLTLPSEELARDLAAASDRAARGI